MLKYIRKDIILNKVQILFYASYLTVFWIWISYQKSFPWRAGIILLSFLVAMIPLTFQAREEKFKATILLCSLPLTRNSLVLARYLTAWVFMLSGLIYGLVIVAIIPNNRVLFQELLALKTLFLFLLFFSLFFSFLLPFTVRFGIMGVMIFLVVMQALGVIMLTLTSLFGGNHFAFRMVMNKVIETLIYIVNHPAMFLYFLAMIISIVILNTVSLKLSQFLYARQDL